MPSPDRFTDSEILAWLDANPRVEARALLSDGRPLKAEEIAFLDQIAKLDRLDPAVLPVFRAIRNRIMLRWATGTPTGAAETSAEEGIDRDRRGLAGTVPPVQRRPALSPAGPRILAATPLRIEVEK